MWHRWKIWAIGLFLTVNQSVFTENEVANQWHRREHSNLCPTLHKRTCAFCLWYACDSLPRTVKDYNRGDLYIFITKCRNCSSCYFDTLVYVIIIWPLVLDNLPNRFFHGHWPGTTCYLTQKVWILHGILKFFNGSQCVKFVPETLYFILHCLYLS